MARQMGPLPLSRCSVVEQSRQTDLLPNIDVPTLVVAGKEDRLISLESSQSLAAVVLGAQFTVITEAGHLTPMEQPIATGRTMREFLESIS